MKRLFKCQIKRNKRYFDSFARLKKDGKVKWIPGISAAILFGYEASQELGWRNLEMLRMAEE